jgi:carbon-monoxide dehydrogenase large subunit
MALLGTPVTRVEDGRLLAGRANFVGNVGLPEVLQVAYVTSPVAHARLVGIGIEVAKAMPGVVAVVTGEDLDLGPYPPVNPDYPPAMARPLLARGTVRFVGEAVVAVVAESIAQAEDAADLVELDLEELPVLLDPQDSERQALLLFPAAGTNVVAVASGGDEHVDVDACDVVVRATFHSHRVAPCPMETRSAASAWGADGRLTHWSSCQGAHPTRNVLCQLYGIDPDRVRVIVPDVGGSFGAKARPYPEEVLLPWLAAATGRPVTWQPARSGDMIGLGHSRVQIQRVDIGGRRDGTIEALRVRLLADAGAYPLNAPLLARNTGVLAPGPYRFARVGWDATSVVTNTTPTTSYRGAGRPEAAALLERAVDLFAAEVGMDTADVRRHNFVEPEAFPHRSPTGLVYDSGDYGKGLDAALGAAGYDQLRAEQARRRQLDDPIQLGIGIATFIDRTAGLPGTEYGAVELRADGGILVRTGSTPYGQGHVTSWTMIVAARTGVPMESIQVVHGDTDLVPRGTITGGSKSVQRAGAAVAVATDELIEQARRAAADVLEAAVDDVILDTADGGRFHVAGTPTVSVGWADVAHRADPDSLRCEADVGGEASFPSGAYVAVVEVDTDTGKVLLQRLVTVDDAGWILNPLLAEGQVHGGAAQGIAQALFEEFVYDAEGNPLTTTFAEYAIPAASELPSFETVMVETISPTNVLGAKGIAESGTIGAPPAVQNAVVDALAHLGVRHIDMPCTPERVWNAIREARGSAHETNAEVGVTD